MEADARGREDYIPLLAHSNAGPLAGTRLGPQVARFPSSGSSVPPPPAHRPSRANSTPREIAMLILCCNNYWVSRRIAHYGITGITRSEWRLGCGWTTEESKFDFQQAKRFLIFPPQRHTLWSPPSLLPELKNCSKSVACER